MLDALKKAEKLLVQLNDIIKAHPHIISNGYHRVMMACLNGVRTKIEWIKNNQGETK